MRCIICDLCDTAGSLSNVWTSSPMVWDEHLNGYVCEDCLQFDPAVDYIDLDFDEDEEDLVEDEA